jgi:hypothetical protein
MMIETFDERGTRASEIRALDTGNPVFVVGGDSDARRQGAAPGDGEVGATHDRCAACLPAILADDATDQQLRGHPTFSTFAR